MGRHDEPHEKPSFGPRLDLPPGSPPLRNPFRNRGRLSTLLRRQPHSSLPRRPKYLHIRGSIHSHEARLRNKHMGRRSRRPHPTPYGLGCSRGPKRYRIWGLARTTLRRAQRRRLARRVTALRVAVPAFHGPLMAHPLRISRCGL